MVEAIIIVIVAVTIGFALGWGFCAWRHRVLDRIARQMPLLGVVFPPERKN